MVNYLATNKSKINTKDVTFPLHPFYLSVIFGLLKLKETDMSKNIIKLSEDYGIGADDFNIILYQRKVNQREETKNFGKEYYSTIGFYSNVESLLKGLINRQIQINLAEQTSLESLINSVETYVNLLRDDVQLVVDSLKGD